MQGRSSEVAHALKCTGVGLLIFCQDIPVDTLTLAHWPVAT